MAVVKQNFSTNDSTINTTEKHTSADPISTEHYLSSNIVSKDEESAYELAQQEIDDGKTKKGLWAKAYAEEKGVKERTKAKYIELRVAQLLKETKISKEKTVASKLSFKEHLLNMVDSSIPDMDHVPSDNFNGDPASLCEAVPIGNVATLSGLLEFQIIDLIKLGKLRGIRTGDNWFVDGAYSNEQKYSLSKDQKRAS